MNPFREYIANAKATKYLHPRYQILTTAIGFAAVLAGIVVWYRCTEVVARLAGIPFDQPLQGTLHIAFAAAWLFVGLPMVLYLSAALVAGSVGALLAAFGKLSRQEVVPYAFLSRYPRSWLNAPGDA